jgi:hypothetical protein
MSMREAAVNLLVGTLLLLVFAVLCLALAGASGVLFYGFVAAVTHFLPGLAKAPEAIFYLLLSFWSLVSSVGHVRKHRWTTAFLSFTVIPMTASFWFAGTHSPLNQGGFSVFPWLVLILSLTEAAVTRFDFLMSAFIVSVCVAVNTGLLGSGHLQQYAAKSVLIAAFMWFVVQLRRGRFDDPFPNAIRPRNT